MNIELIVIGKTDSKEVNALVDMYTKRINFYNRFSITYIPDIRNAKNLSQTQQKTTEGEAILKLINEADRVVILDEKGTEFRSVEYADWLQKRMNSGVKRLVFVVGGPYGFSEAVYNRADEKISLSKMTFSHQIIRAIFTEQLYRAFTILRGEPYHHE
ncbi:MAG: 23S rRNA (pseudouridine(1915)-N(3))-methyltransferase RlmH [Alistipes sp.]|nr:23S rRNA (pseudouridine(1915)-N(3))-methyltransferase RlmH [Alistipes sp.]